MDPKDRVEIAEAYQLARLAQRMQRLDTAEELFHFVVTADPDNNAGWIEYGGVLRQQRRFSEARDALERAVALRRGSSGLVLLASAERELGRHTQAQAPLEEALRASTSPTEVWRELGRLRLVLEDWVGATEAFEKVLELSPRDERARQALEALRQQSSGAAD